MSDQSKSTSGELEQYECQLCKKTFKYDSHYKRHLQTHTDDRPFECEICGKKFKRQDALKTHTLMHSDNLPFKCTFDGCLESFASKAALRYHELRHQNQSVYICDIDNCGKKFITIGQLNQHQRTRIHSKKQKQFTPNDSDLSSNNNQLETLNSENEIDQNQQACNISIPSTQQLINYQQFYEFQNDQIPFKNNSNLMSNMSNYLQPEIINYQKFTVKQEETFLDKFCNNEQEIINQIWNNTKKERPADYHQQIKTEQDQKFQDSCNNGRCDDYPIIKRRKNSETNSYPITTPNAQSSTTSNLLQEFIRLNSSGYSFSRLKQELRVIVGLIDQIKKEDEEIESQVQNKQLKKQSLYGNQFMDKMNINHRNDQNYYFYQNDENPFYNQQCKYIHEYLPNDVLGNFDKNSKQNQYMNMDGFKNNSLQKNKISTAVRILQYSKKTFTEQKKQQMIQIQQEQTNVQQPNLLQMTRKSSFYNNTQTNNFYPVEQQQQNFEFNFENNMNDQQMFTQVPEFRLFNYENNEKCPILINTNQQIQNNTPAPDVFNNPLPNIFEFPVFNYNPQQNMLNQFNQIQNLNNQVTANLQPINLQRGFSYQINAHAVQTPNNTQSKTKNPFSLGISQDIYHQTQNEGPVLKNIFDQSEEDYSSQFQSNETQFEGENMGNIFDDADEPMNQIFGDEFYQMNQFMPDMQLNNFSFYNQAFQA